MKKRNNKGFTLVEMLVVIVIIALLASVLVTSIRSLKEHGNKTKCKANLKSLAQGVINKAAEQNGHTMYASSFVTRWLSIDTGGVTWHHMGGGSWISWLDGTRFPNPPSWDSGPGFTYPSCFAGNKNGRDAIRQGEMWGRGNEAGYINKSMEIFLCPSHKNIKMSGNPVCRSYAMNGFFGYSTKNNGRVESPSDGLGLRETHKLQNVDEPMRVMLFAEIDPVKKEGRGWSTSVLVPWNDCPNLGDRTTRENFLADNKNLRENPRETISFHHKSQGKKFGNVAFLDGHVKELPEEYLDADFGKVNPTLRAALGLY